VSGSSIPEKGELQVKSEAKKEPEYFPISVAIDSAGRVFFADKDNNRVCLIVDNGAMRVVAGKGTPGFAGDGGPAVDALLWWPYAVVVDRAGALLIADSGNNRIRRVSLDGTIDTLAGNGLSGLSGDGGAATKASLNHPCGLAFDNEDNLLIADSWNHCIRKVDGKGKITTVAGIGQPGCTGDGGPARKARLYHPYGMAVSRDGGIWVTERSSNRVRLVRPDGTIVSVAGEEIAGFHGDGGPAARAKLNRPCGIAMDAAGNLYIADSWNHRIRRIASNVMA
jgi:DNA-binding beta-propeller fold protein YncE